MDNKIKVVAYYLPQYHPFPENDEWWGKGFTEWTNVARAKPLYRGHSQPKIPADLGFYDLRLQIVREQQATLAKEAGIYGFCYWHYWFGNGKQLMHEIFDEVLQSGKPDFPFCLGWANHSWYAKNWNTTDTGKRDRLLIEQTYPGDDDIRKHYEYVRNAFMDSRYIKQDGKPIFVIFRPEDIPHNFIELWNKWAIDDGFLNGIYFIARFRPTSFDESGWDDYINRGFSAIIPERLRKNSMVSNYAYGKRKLQSLLSKITNKYLPNRFDYEKMTHFFSYPEMDRNNQIIPTIIPNFDHSPRSKNFGYILDKSTPSLFQKHCEDIFESVASKDNKLVWLRSWNEWGEGNYLEPDSNYGKGYIYALREAIIRSEQ